MNIHAAPIDISVVIPAKDEAKRLPQFLKILTAHALASPHRYEIIVVDDGSRDTTSECALVYQKLFSNLSVIRLEVNHGKGYSVKHGLRSARGAICVFMDADGSTLPDEIEKNIFYFEKGYDIVIGSRNLNSPQHTIKAKGYRKLMGRFFRFCVNKFLFSDITDTQCGFKMFKKEIIRPLLAPTFINGFGFDLELLFLARQMGFKIKETPVSWHHVNGSKINLVSDSLRMFINILQIRSRHIRPLTSTTHRLIHRNEKYSGAFKTHLAIFDFDGTITRNSKKDGLIDFILYAVGPIHFVFGLLCLVPIFFLYMIRILNTDLTKEIVLCFFFKDWSQNKFKEIASCYSRERLPLFLRKEAMEKIGWHKNQHHTIVVATASPEIYLKDWCDSQGLDLVGTQLEFKDGKLTGKLLSKNCKGKEKVNRIRQKYNLSSFDQIYAYGDSPADLVLKEIAHQFFYRSF